MTVRLSGVERVGTASTSGAVSANVVTFDFSAIAEIGGGALDNLCSYIEGLLLGRTSAGNACKIAVIRTITRNSGTVAGIAVAETISTTASAALSGVAADLEISGNEIRLKATGIAAQDIDWVGFLNVWSTPA